jgi:LytS/YehU family sensor histidine kinase
VLVQFDAPRRRLVLGSLAVAMGAVIAGPFTSDGTVFGLYVVMLAGAIAAAGWALWNRGSGAALAFAGLLAGGIALILTDDLFPARYFAPVFAVFATGLLGTLALRAHREAARRRGAELRETRLELELVKRHLQPHFLKNTLTAAMEWMEADPERGVAFLDSVADLLSSINAASNQTLIPVGDELDMCRAYLHVMSGRTGQTYQLNLEDVSADARIPPALFLTLVENGVTHARRRPDTTVGFSLRETASGDRRRYKLTVSPVQEPDRVSGDGADASARGGTGLRYVRSRLAEVTPEHSLRSSFTPPDAWQTDIELPLHLSPADITHASSAS